MKKFFEILPIFFAVICFIIIISHMIYSCNHQYVKQEITTDVVIHSEIVNIEGTARSSVEAFYFICVDSNRVYRVRADAFKAYPKTLPGDSFRLKIIRNIPTKFAEDNADTTIEATVLKKLK